MVDKVLSTEYAQYSSNRSGPIEAHTHYDTETEMRYSKNNFLYKFRGVANAKIKLSLLIFTTITIILVLHLSTATIKWRPWQAQVRKYRLFKNVYAFHLGN
jgi:hypothetical protein